MLNDRLIIWICGYVTLAFILSCLVDVLKIYPLMDNLAIVLLFVSGYIFIIVNVIMRATSKEDIKENLPEHEDEPSEFRQI